MLDTQGRDKILSWEKETVSPRRSGLRWILKDGEKYSTAGVPNLWDLMPDDLRWSWCNKEHNKCNVLESSPNHPHHTHGKTVFHETGPWCWKGWGVAVQGGEIGERWTGLKSSPCVKAKVQKWHIPSPVAGGWVGRRWGQPGLWRISTPAPVRPLEYTGGVTCLFLPEPPLLTEEIFPYLSNTYSHPSVQNKLFRTYSISTNAK